MWKFIFKRVFALIPVIIGVTLIVFFIMSLSPGDPAKMILGDEASPEAVQLLRQEMGLDDPLLIQYSRYMYNAIQGDMGLSYKSKKPVTEEIWARFPNTIKLTLTAMTLAVIISLPLGIIAAVRQNSFFDGFSMLLALFGVSMPPFWFGLLLILFFSLKLGWFPSSGSESLKSIVLPSVALGFLHMASIARTTRSSMLEVIRQDYIRTARSKGLSYSSVIRKHALKNALIPTITVVGLQVGVLLGGAVIVETVFAWPGVGRLMVQSIMGRDIPMVMGCIILFATGFTIVNLIVDLLYGFIDPRIRSMYT
ncbi:MAG: ABC transporter permease [Anaerolineae bacterium]|nr:ABC transporter permease [Anaerolineae bacterium]